MDQFFDITGCPAPVGIPPPNAIPFLKHDIGHFKSIDKEGKLLCVNWKGVNEGSPLGRLIHQAIKVHMVHGDEARCSTRQQIDVDWLLAKKKAAEFIWHGDHSAYYHVVAFTEDTCKKIHQKAQARWGSIGDNSILTESVYQGMRSLGNNEASQKSECAMYTLPTLDLVKCAQKSTRHCKGGTSKLIETLLGCRCWGKLQTEAVQHSHSCWLPQLSNRCTHPNFCPSLTTLR
jgi:hypothetical protein